MVWTYANERLQTTSSTTTSTTTTPAVVATSTPLCLTDDTAAHLVNGYASLLTAYTNATANALLASNFTDTSDSINWIAGIPLGSATFSSLAAFIAGQGTQNSIGFTVYETMYSCTQVAFRWVAVVGYQTYPAKGINVRTPQSTYPSSLSLSAAYVSDDGSSLSHRLTVATHA
jgi:hypothetical protein